MKLLQESQAEPNDMQRRINQIICLQQTRDQVIAEFKFTRKAKESL
jgi:hypothetical protein